MNEIKKYTEKIFDDIKYTDKYGNDYWLAREFQRVLEYVQWRRFNDVINKAIIACENSKVIIDEHFAKVGKTIKMPKGASKLIEDYKLSRYACYLIVKNG